MPVIGRFQKTENGFSGSIDTLLMHLNPVWFTHREKGADFAVFGPDDTELGAAWRRTGEFGDFLSVRLDCPTLAAPISAVMTLKTDDEGFFLLRWHRRKDPPVRGNLP